VRFEVANEIVCIKKIFIPTRGHITECCAFHKARIIFYFMFNSSILKIAERTESYSNVIVEEA